MNYKLDTDERVFFYEQEFYVFSNFSAFTLFWAGKKFDTSEIAYQYEKFRGNTVIQDIVMSQLSTHAAYTAAQNFKDHIREDWDEVKVPIMRDILRAKVEQHGYVEQKLLETGNREIIEDSWRDDFWGWGENKDGQNMLGKLWMEIRDDIRHGK